MSAPVRYEYADITPEEFGRRIKLAIAELDGPEGDAIREHIRWFRRRYATPLERLRYATRKHKEWSATRGILTNPR